jgi:hypothetical protein
VLDRGAAVASEGETRDRRIVRPATGRQDRHAYEQGGRHPGAAGQGRSGPVHWAPGHGVPEHEGSHWGPEHAGRGLQEGVEDHDLHPYHRPLPIDPARLERSRSTRYAIVLGVVALCTVSALVLLFFALSPPGLDDPLGIGTPTTTDPFGPIGGEDEVGGEGEEGGEGDDPP